MVISDVAKEAIWPSWPIVKADLEAHFWIDVLKEESYRKFRNLKQGQLLIKVFVQQFDILWIDMGMVDNYALHIFKENINYNIYFQLSF